MATATTFPPATELSKEETLTNNVNGYKAKNVYSIVAASQAAALAYLQTVYNLYYGQVYADMYGNILDPNCTCQSVAVTTESPAPYGGTGLYKIVADFSRVDVGNACTPQPGGPPVYLWKISEQSTSVDHDQNLNPLVNSRGRQFKSSMPPVLQNRITLEVRWYVTSPNYSQLGLYSKSVNSVTWNTPVGTFAPRTMKSMGINPQPAGKNSVLLTAQYEYEPNTWDLQIRDQDDQGNLLNGMGVRLDGLPVADEGTAGTPAGATINNVSGKAVFLVWRYYTELDPSQLGI